MASIPTAPRETNHAALNFQTFGEHTSVPIAVRKASVQLSEPLPFIDKSIAVLELGVANETVTKDISSKLRLSLPSGASVKKFELFRNEAWIPATAVPKKESKEIVYKEKEKGRDVAAVSNVGSGSNVFEIEVSPLPYKVVVQIRLELMVDDGSDDVDFLVKNLLPRDSSTSVLVEKIQSKLSGKYFAASGKSDDKKSSLYGGAVVGDCFGRTHFVCRIPSSIGSTDGQGNPPTNKIGRIAVAWDSSASMTCDNTIDARCTRLKELVGACLRTGPVQIELFSFSCQEPAQIGNYDNAEDLIEAIGSIEYDGGTNIKTLARLVSDLASRNSTERVDAMLVFTDGMDNLGRSPKFANSHEINFAVHCIADHAEINMACLRSITSASPRFPGVIFTEKDASYIPGVLTPLPVLRSIKTDQTEEAFVEEVDDGFRCIPDHRLGTLNHPIGHNGILISGILKQKEQEVPCSVTKLIAEVSIGVDKHEFHFTLQEPHLETLTKMHTNRVSTNQHLTIHRCETLSLAAAPESKAPHADHARLLGFVYAEHLYAEAESFGRQSGLDVKVIQEEVATRYGFCSPESTLLMLYEVDQFLVHGILPPVGHPAWTDDRIVALAGEKADNKKHSSASLDGPKPGEIGAPKTDEQKAEVQKLARELHTYFTTPWKQERLEKGQNRDRESERERGLVGAAERASMETCFEECCGPEGDCSGSDEDDDYYLLNRPRTVSAANDWNFSGGPGARARGAFCGGPSATVASQRARGAFHGASATVAPQRAGGARRMTAGGMGARRQNSIGSRYVPPSERRGEAAFGGEACMGERMDICKNKSGAAVAPKSREAHVVGTPKDPKEYTAELEKTLKEADSTAAWLLIYKTELSRLGNFGSASPSFFLNTARVLVGHGKATDAIRVVSNCLETGIEDVQMLRSVGYLLLSTETGDGLSLAIELFDKVCEIAPSEPQSFLDASLARFWKCRKDFEETSVRGAAGDLPSRFEHNITKSQELLVRVMTHQWASRFSEVEWPAMILLHYLADFVEEVNRSPMSSSLAVWPEELTRAEQSDDGLLKGFCYKSVEVPAVCVWLGWDTDKTDVDLHVHEPSGERVYYENKRGKAGSLLSRDFVQGYGPEVYILKDVIPEETSTGVTRRSRGMVGKYNVFAKYFASHQDSSLTGATSAVVWTITKTKDGKKDMNFSFVRLNSHKEKTQVATIELKDN